MIQINSRGLHLVFGIQNVSAAVNGRTALSLSVSGTNFDDFGRNCTLLVDEDRLGDAGVALEPPPGHQLA